jgi:hypothetical protein
MLRIRKMRRAVLATAVLLLTSAATLSQVYYGILRGTVTDATGSIAPGIEVTVTNLDTNISQKFVSNEVGNYVAPNLIPGKYRITAEHSGFKKFIVDDIELVATADRRVDIRLEVGAVTESVTVEGGAQLIETERATLSDVKPNAVFTYMPINSNYRSIWRMLQLTPALNGSYYAGVGLGRNSTFSIDGIPVKDGWTGSSFGPALTYLDSYRELRMDLVSVNASGGTAAQIAVVSESGTNQFHGEAWMHYNAVGFTARNFFAPARPHGPPIFRPNLKIGGPLLLPKLYDGRNRTFFHYSWQGLRGSQSPTTTNLTVPGTAFRAGDFSALSTTLVDPLTRAPFAGNRIPASRISSTSTYFQDTFYPLPNATGDFFRAVTVFPNKSDQHTGRMDHRLSDANSLYLRAMYQTYWYITYDGGNNPNMGLYEQWRDQYHVVLSDTHVISPRMLNEFRLGYARDESEYGGKNRGLDVVRAAGLDLGTLPDVPAVPGISITGFSGISQAGLNGWMWSTFHLQEALHLTHGRHNFRFGIELGKYNGKQYATSPSSVYGSFSFDGRFSGNPYADFLLGLMAGSSRRTSVGPVYPHRLNKEFYAQDDFKVTPNLSLNLGVRWSILDPGTIEQNLIANFYPAKNALVVADEAALAQVHPGFPKNIPIITASAAGLSNKLLNIDRNNFAPRLGVAWRPAAIKDFVVRAGAGVYYVAMQPYISDGGGAPFELAESFTNSVVGGNPDFSFPSPFPARGFTAVPGGLSGSGMDPNLRTPYTMQFSLAAEKQVGDMGVSLEFISTRSRKNIWGYDLNAVRADTTPFAVKFATAPFPYFYGINYTINGSSHNYQAGVIKVERRFKRGLYFQNHLTLSKSVGDDWSTSSEDAFDRRRDRSQGGAIPRWRAVFLALYNLPFGRGSRYGNNLPKPLELLVGNWSLGGTYIAQTGLYFTPAFSGADISNTNRTSGRPDRIADGNLASGQRTIERWFDTAGFVRPPAGIGRYGTSAPFILEGPGINVFHVGLNKEFAIHERAKLKFEAVSTNFFNHPNFANPGTTMGTSTYGVITSMSGGSSSSSGEGPRDFSFTVRFLF